MRLSRPLTALAAVASLVLISGACSGDSSDGTDSATGKVTIAKTTLTAPLDQVYEGEEIISSGEVTASWYQSGGKYIVIYSGANLENVGPACPGNSIRLADGSSANASNAPTEAGACTGTSTPEPTTPPEICGDLVIYTTEISTDSEGTLYGSFEIVKGDSTLGATSTVATDVASAPELSVGASEYEFDGLTYSCGLV